MMKQMRMTIAAMVATVAAILLGSCNHTEYTLGSRIPADRPCIVANIDLNRLASDCEVRLEGDSLVLPQWLKWVDGYVPSAMSAKGMAVLKSLDCSTMLYYCDLTSPSNGFVTARISDRKAFDEAMEKVRSSERRSENGFDVDVTGSYRMMSRDNTVWFTSMSTDSLMAAFDRAGRVNIDRLAGVRQKLDADGFLRFGVMSDPGSDPDGQTGSWEMGVVRLDGPRLAMDGFSMLADGKPVEQQWLSPLSSDFLRFIPDSMNIVAALQRNDTPVTAQSIIDKINSLPNMAGMYQIKSLIQSVAPYIEAIDGTAAMAARINNGMPDMVLLAHMDQGKANSAVSQIMAFCSQLGVNATRDERTGIYSASIPLAPRRSITVHAGVVDGYLLITTFDPQKRFSNSYASTFEGKDAACVISVDALQGQPFEVRSQASEASSHTVAMFGDSGEPFMESLSKWVRSLL